MVVLWIVEELPVCWVELGVVLRELDVEVLDPAEFAINVSFLGKLGVVWHASALHFVFIIWVKLSLWIDHLSVSGLEVLSKVLLQRGNRELVTADLSEY